jgi:hypothetical protein
MDEGSSTATSLCTLTELVVLSKRGKKMGYAEKVYIAVQNGETKIEYL